MALGAEKISMIIIIVLRDIMNNQDNPINRVNRGSDNMRYDFMTYSYDRQIVK